MEIIYGAGMLEPAPETDQHRRKITWIGALAVMLLLGVLIWLVQWIVEQQRMERCLASRRPDCFRIETPVRDGPVELKR